VERRQRHLKATYDRLLEKYTVDVEGARHTKQMPTVARTEQR
jgi:hypothetical protein